MTEPAADLARRTPDAIRSTTRIVITFSDGSEATFDPTRVAYPVAIVVEQTTSVIAPGLSERVG
jgi:hypothetical protein